MQILGYIIGFILILAVIFIPICLVAFGVPFLLILLFRLLRGILYCFLDLFTKKKRISGYWNRNFGRESLKNLAGKCCYWAFLIITFFFDSDDDGGSSDSGAPEGEAALAEAVQDEVSKTFLPQGEPFLEKFLIV